MNYKIVSHKFCWEQKTMRNHSNFSLLLQNLAITQNHVFGGTTHIKFHPTKTPKFQFNYAGLNSKNEI